MRATQLDHIAHEFELIEASCARHKALVASKEKVGRLVLGLPSYLRAIVTLHVGGNVF